MTTRGQALRSLGLVVADFTAAFMEQTPEDAARRAWRPGGPSLSDLTARCADLQARVRQRAAPEER